MVQLQYQYYFPFYFTMFMYSGIGKPATIMLVIKAFSCLDVKQLQISAHSHTYIGFLKNKALYVLATIPILFPGLLQSMPNAYILKCQHLPHSQLTLLRVPKNNQVKGFLRSILIPTWVLESFLTPAKALKICKNIKVVTRFAPMGMGSKLTPGTLNKVNTKSNS